MKYILLLSFLIISFQVNAQTDPIDTDRPDQTESVNTVPKGWFQFEAGFNFIKTNSAESALLFPTLLSKYGISKQFEFRLITTLESAALPSKTFTGLLPVQIGTKISLWQQKKLLPQTSVIYHLTLPRAASESKKINLVAHEFKLLLQNELSRNVALGINLGSQWDAEETTFIYTIAPGFNLSEKWYTYAEAFGSFSKGEAPQHNIDGGLAYYVTPDMKADISAGFGLTADAPKYYFAVGYSVRFK